VTVTLEHGLMKPSKILTILTLEGIAGRTAAERDNPGIPAGAVHRDRLLGKHTAAHLRHIARLRILGLQGAVRPLIC
jgi:hypothetical protein